MKTNIFEIGIENFRVFKEKMEFEFAPITILTGTNSSGKSSLMRAFYLMNFCFENGDLKEILDVEDVLNIMGDFSKLPNKKNLGNKKISFYLPIVLRGIIDKTQLKVSYELIIKENNSLNQGRLVELSIISEKSEKEILEIKRKNEYEFEININFGYFLEEYKRESEQIREYKSKKQVLIDKELERIHPQYFEFEKFGVLNESQYRPFFDKYPGFFNEEEYEKIYERINSYCKEQPIYYNPKQKIIEITPYSFEADNLNIYTDFFLDNYKIFKENGILGNLEPVENSILKTFSLNIKIEKEIKPNRHKAYKIKSNDYTLSIILRNLDYWIKNIFQYFPWVPVDNGKSHVDCNVDKLELSEDYKNLILRNSLADFFSREFIRNDFFFECFVDDNIRYSISEALEQLGQCYFLGNYRNQVQRIYNSKDGSDFQALIKKIVHAEKENKIVKKYIKKYLTRFEIGHDYEIVNSGEGQGYFLYIKVKGENVLLADMGYGISQVLPLIFKIISVALEEGDKKKLFIEEPESNLHPALQSKLAELFADAAEDFGIQFVIETHSEYFIRKLQMLTANTYARNKSGKLPALKTTDTQIYYFNHPDKVEKGQKQVYKINIEEDGALTKNFGKGFYDEASTLNIALYDYTSANKN